MSIKNFLRSKARPERKADKSAVLVVPYFKVWTEAQHSTPESFDILRQSFAFYKTKEAYFNS